MVSGSRVARPQLRKAALAAFPLEHRSQAPDSLLSPNLKRLLLLSRRLPVSHGNGFQRLLISLDQSLKRLDFLNARNYSEDEAASWSKGDDSPCLMQRRWNSKRS